MVSERLRGGPRWCWWEQKNSHLNTSNSMPLVSDTVWNIRELQNQQTRIWEAAQGDIKEVKKTLGTVMSSIQTGNDRLKTVPAGAPRTPVLFG
jgi:hypothetical protein